MIPYDESSMIGFAAAVLTLLAFAQKRMLPMRFLAIGANISFIGYGFLNELYPVLVLHIVLLPINAVRLAGDLPRRGGALQSTPMNDQGSSSSGAMGWV